MKKYTYRHIGYYNDSLDIEELFLETPDSIIILMKEHFGKFYSCEGDRETDIDDIEIHPDKNLLEMTTDKEYIVKYQRGSQNKDDWFIDIYQYHELDENDEDYCIERCSYCGNLVSLKYELKTQKCPKCGKYIVPCNICPLKTKCMNECMNACPLHTLSIKLNCNIEFDDNALGIESSIESFIKIFNLSTIEQKEKGFTCKCKRKGNIIKTLIIFYSKENNCICFIDGYYSGKSFSIKNNCLSIRDTKIAFENLDLEDCEYYVKPL